MTDALKQQLEAALGAQVKRLARIAGGDINDAYALTMADGARLFVKTRAQAPAGMYAREAEGLAFLAEAKALRTPEVRYVDDTLLVLAWLDKGHELPDFDERFGRGLATLHLFGAPTFGLAHDNFIGPLPQDNRATSTWVEFYRERRLAPMIARAAPRGPMPASMRRDLDALLLQLEQRLGPEEPPSRLHGDLWTGNVHVDKGGKPVLIDPAVYGGHREIDLAMLALFGSPSSRFYAAYDEVYPRAQGHREREPLYQLYPLLVHVSLFGASYLSPLGRAISSCI